MATKKKAPESDLLVTAAEAIGSTLGNIVSAVRQATASAKKKAAKPALRKKAVPVKAAKKVVKKVPAKKAAVKKTAAKKKTRK